MFVHPGCPGLVPPGGLPVVCAFVCTYLLDILLKHAQLQPLVQSDLPMLPDILKTPLMVEDLMHNIQDAVNLQK